MKKEIHITYCCKNKQKSACNSSVPLSELYISHRVQSFINFCKKQNYSWGIFSDLYGLVLSSEKIKWYNKPPAEVTDEEYKLLLKTTLTKLKQYDKIFFYYTTDSFHPLYLKLVSDLKLYKTVQLCDWLVIYDERN